MWKPILDSEDRADQMTGEDQEDAYGRLLVQVRTLQVTPEVEARKSRIDARLEKKQAFARKRRLAESVVEKSEVVQAAFEIGDLHLADNDPRRALVWVKIIVTYDPQSSEAGNLTNRIVDWFDAKVRAHIQAGQYYEVEKEIKRWRTLRPDPANPDIGQEEAQIQTLIVEYAKHVRQFAITPYLKLDLAIAEKSSLTEINGEMEFPFIPDPEITAADKAKRIFEFWRGSRKGQDWDEIDIDIQSALEKRIKQAEAEQTKKSAEDMQIVIDAYDRLYPRKSTAEFRQQLGNLRQLLKDRDEPLKDDRAGVVKGALIRFSALIGQGTAWSRSGAESAKQSQVMIPMLDIQFNAWKARDSMLWFEALGQKNTDYGFGLQAHLFNINDSQTNLTFLQAHFGFDVRVNGESWTLGVRMGPMFIASKFTGLDATTQQNSISVLSLAFKGEKGFKLWNKWFSVHAEYQLTTFDKFSWNKFSITGRWYVMNNLALGLGYETLNLSQFAEKDTQRIVTYFGVPAVELIFQF